MSSPLRIAILVVGLAVAVYGVASLTGGWLGFPPRYEVITPPAVEAVGQGGWVTYEAVLRDGGEATGIGLIVVGVLMIAVGAWPPAATRGGRVVSSALRIVLVVVGVAAVVYGMSGLSAVLPAGFIAVEQLLSIPLGLLLILVGAWPRGRRPDGTA